MTEPHAIDVPLHLDARGWLLATDAAFEGLEVAYAYATSCYPGVVKGWHRHQAHTDRMLGVEGVARVVVAKIMHDMDPRDMECNGMDVTNYATFHEFVTGPLSPKLVIVPPGWWHAFCDVGGGCTLLNAPDMPYDPDDEERLELGAIPYEWENVNG